MTNFNQGFAGSRQAVRAPAQKPESVAGRCLPAVIPVPLTLTTAFIVRDRGVLLVDTGNPGDEAAILTAMKRDGIEPDEEHAEVAAEIVRALRENDTGKLSALVLQAAHCRKFLG